MTRTNLRKSDPDFKFLKPEVENFGTMLDQKYFKRL